MLLDYTTLNVTLKEVAFKKDAPLQSEIERILEHNKVEPTREKEGSLNKPTQYYKIDLTAEHIEQILDMLFELEANHVDEDGVATPTGSFYATLVDKWMAIKHAG